MDVAVQAIIVSFLLTRRFDALLGPFLAPLEVATVRPVLQDSPARILKILQPNVQWATGQRVAPQHAPSAALGELNTSKISPRVDYCG